MSCQDLMMHFQRVLFSFSSVADAFRAIAEDVTSASQILLNVEYESNGVKMASILNASNKEDVAKGLIGEGEEREGKGGHFLALFVLLQRSFFFIVRSFFFNAFLT